MRNDFAVFITSYKKANDIVTIDSLLNAGYTGDWYVIVEDNDPELEEYKNSIPKEKLLLYNKKEQSKYYDSYDNFHILNTNLNSLSVVSYFAKKLGYKYFYIAEDDYEGFYYKKRIIKNKVVFKKLKNIDDIFEISIDFLNSNDKINCLSFTPIKTTTIGNADFFSDSFFNYLNYNGWLCDIDKPIKFKGTICNDTLTFMNNYKQGHMSFTLNYIKNIHKWYYDKKEKELDNSGNDEINDKYFTDVLIYYLYNIMGEPAAYKIFTKNGKIREKFIIKHLIPKIIDERWKK